MSYPDIINILGSQEICAVCNGTGQVSDVSYPISDELIVCPYCTGAGHIIPSEGNKKALSLYRRKQSRMHRAQRRDERKLASENISSIKLPD